MMFLAFAFKALILQFDGSLRPPKEPVPGYMSPSDAKSDNMFSSCGAAIFSESHSVCGCHSTPKYYMGNLMALGGKNLPPIRGKTSADVEYEGLLFGLDWVIRALSHENIMRDYILLHSTMIVRGDCKTVIDQLNSRSSARKMESKYCMAVTKITEIENIFSSHRSHSAQFTNAQEINIHFDHIPRENNSLCDAVCRLVGYQKQRCIVGSVIDTIRTEELNASGACRKRIPNRRSFKKAKKITSSENSFFQTAVEAVSSRQLPLCHSSKVALACMLTEAAIRTSDPVALYHMSSFFLGTSRHWDRVYSPQKYIVDSTRHCTSEKTINVDKETLQKLSLVARTMSLQMWGFTNDAEECAKKNNINIDIIDEEINDTLKAILGHSTNFDANISESSDITVEDHILSPFMSISGIVNAVTGIHLRDALIRWNKLAVTGELRDYGLWLEERIK